MNQAIQCFSREAPPGPSSPAEHIHWYHHQRLEKPLWQSVSNGSMVGYQHYWAHNWLRVAGRLEGSPPFPTSDRSEASVDVPLRRQLSSCLPTESGIPELDLFVTCRVSIARFSSSRSGYSVDSMGQVVGICLSTNSVEAASTSQVGSLKSVSNACSGSTSALPAVAFSTS